MSRQATEELSRDGDDPVARLLSLSGPRPALSTERAARLAEAVRPSWQEAVQSRGRRRATWIGSTLAAAALLTVFLGLHWWRPLETATTDRPVARLVAATGTIHRLAAAHGDAGSYLTAGQVLAAGDRLASGDGRAALEMGCGASLRLDSGTAVRLLAADRLALDRGAVYIDSAGPGDVSAAVRIETAYGTVEEIGTQFEVRLLASSLRLRIREGSVVLEHERGSYRGREGEELLLGPETSLARATVPRHGAVWEWTQEIAPILDLEGQTLASYLRWVGRETGTGVAFSDRALEHDATTTQVHGDIEGLRPRESLAVVLPACGVRHRFDGGTLIVEAASAP